MLDLGLLTDTIEGYGAESEPIEIQPSTFAATPSSGGGAGDLAGLAATGGVPYGDIAGAAADALMSTQQAPPNDNRSSRSGNAASSTATGNKVFNFGDGDAQGGTVEASTTQKTEEASGIAATGKSLGIIGAIAAAGVAVVVGLVLMLRPKGRR